jgi:hypothetical protein
MDEPKVMAEAQKAAEEITSQADDDFMAAGSHLTKAVKSGLL